MKCSWCLKDNEMFCSHHFPITKANGGKETVPICVICHKKIHGGFLIDLVSCQNEEAAMRRYWKIYYRIWRSCFPGLTFYEFYESVEREFILNPIWAVRQYQQALPGDIK